MNKTTESSRLPLTKYAPFRFNFDEICPKQTLIKLNQVDNELKPVFFIHPIEGNVECLRPLASHILYPVYGLQITAESPLTTIPDLAEFYLQHVYTVDPVGPYTFVGYSAGCGVGLEMGIQLQKQHPDRKDIVKLILLDGSHCIEKDIRAKFNRTFKPSNEIENITIDMIFFLCLFTSVDMLDAYRTLSVCRDWNHMMETVSGIVMRTQRIKSRGELVRLAGQFYRLTQAIMYYDPDVKYIGDITLILAKRSFLLNGTLGRDYRLHQVCDGEIHTIEMEGDHESFLMDDSTEILAKTVIPLL